MDTKPQIAPPQASPYEGSEQPSNFGVIYGPGIFSLVCCDCDNGSHIHTLDEALAEGWEDITEDLDLVQANYVGRCPDCQELGEEE